MYILSLLCIISVVIAQMELVVPVVSDLLLWIIY